MNCENSYSNAFKNFNLEQYNQCNIIIQIQYFVDLGKISYQIFGKQAVGLIFKWSYTHFSGFQTHENRLKKRKKEKKEKKRNLNGKNQKIALKPQLSEETNIEMQEEETGYLLLIKPGSSSWLPGVHFR